MPNLDPCPKCGYANPNPWFEWFPESLQSPGRWRHTCGWSYELVPPIKKDTTNPFKKVHSGCPKVWRMFKCIICQELQVGEFVEKQIVCRSTECVREKARQYAAWVTSGRPLVPGKKWYEK